MFGKKKDSSGMDRTQAVEIGKDVGREFTEMRIGTYASSTAFFFFLSFIPILILALRLLPSFGLEPDVLIHFIKGITPEIAHNLIETIARESLRASRRLVPFSVILLVWAASQGTIAMLFGLNQVYCVKERRNYLQICLISIGYTIVLLAVIGALIYLIFGNSMIGYMSDLVPELAAPGPKKRISQAILFLIIGTFIFALIYTFFPAGRRNFLRQLPGALFSAAAWLVFSYVFRFYVNGSNRYTSFYGSLAIVGILLFWLYCCFYILLLGGFFNEYFNETIRRKKSNE